MINEVNLTQILKVFLFSQDQFPKSLLVIYQLLVTEDP